MENDALFVYNKFCLLKEGCSRIGGYFDFLCNATQVIGVILIFLLLKKSNRLLLEKRTNRDRLVKGYKLSVYKMNKVWGSDIKHGDCC